MLAPVSKMPDHSGFASKIATQYPNGQQDGIYDCAIRLNLDLTEQHTGRKTVTVAAK